MVKATLKQAKDKNKNTGGALRAPSLGGGNLRASSFGGYESTTNPKHDYFLRRGSAPGCNSRGNSIDLVSLIHKGLPVNQSMEQQLAAHLSKVHLLTRHSLSPSVESEIIDQVVTSCITSGVNPPSSAALQSALNRRGSLPTDLDHLPRFTPVEPSS